MMGFRMNWLWVMTSTRRDDEDGLESGDILIPGENTILFVRQGDVAGILNAWIDFNRDGDWDDEGEQIATERGGRRSGIRPGDQL